MIGSNNGVAGNQNLVIGDSNKVVGSNNYVFAQGFNGQVNDNLILSHWAVQNDKKQLIPVDPALAISQW
jgi:hypothetical protein